MNPEVRTVSADGRVAIRRFLVTNRAPSTKEG